MDNGEVIAIDIPYGVYAGYQSYYREAFVSAMESSLGTTANSVYITNFQSNSAGGTLIYFDTILMGTDYDVADNALAVKALFNTQHQDCAATAPVACPAHSQLIGAFVANGLPVTGVYYNDQLTSTSNAGYVPAPVNASRVGTWKNMDGNEVIAIDIIYGFYATNQQYFKEAFTLALEKALNVPHHSVYVNDFQQTPAGTTNIYFDIIVPDETSSASVPQMFENVQKLFTNCHPLTNDTAGCPAQSTPCYAQPCTSPLVDALLEFGLPLTNAYYNTQLPPAGH